MKHPTRFAMLLTLLLPYLLAACSLGAPNGSSTATEENSSQQAASTPEAASVDTNSGDSPASEAETVERPDDWDEDSHGDEADPNYEVVFPDDEVNQITITIDSADWEAMQANMTELFGEAGQGEQGGGFGGGLPGGDRPAGDPPFQSGEGGEPPIQGQPPAGQAPGGGPGGGGFGGGGGGFGGDFTTENPMWVSATIQFEGQTWTNVGVRYKGNSTLAGAWRNGDSKLPLKLDFDEFEEEYPDIADQRFYGFKQLSLSSNYGDASYLRETVAYDLLEDAGLVAANTAFYEVILDYGEGPVSLGLYTMVEVVDDTVIENAFADDSGNIYEGDGQAASLAEGTYDQIASSFQKENNEDEANWSDVEALYNVLHSSERTNNPEAWRATLEAAFDVDTFLEWLAISAVIQHWDTYGSMSHNFYLYNNPETGQLTWISWDHNFILSAGDGNGGGGGGGMGRRSTSLDKAEVEANWPLIRYLLDDPVYYAKYVAYMETFANETFNADTLAAKYQHLASLIAPYATQESGEESFNSAVQALTEATQARAEAVAEFLTTQK